jgi:hypothetical protein
MATPITQRAATKYGSVPANQEVTVDAAGKNAAKFERMSPLKQTTNEPAKPDLTRNVGQYSTPTATVGGGSPGTPPKEVKSTKIIPGEKPTSIVHPGEPGYEEWEKAVANGAGQQFLPQEIETTDTIPGTPGTDWEGTLQTSTYSTVKKPWQIRQQSRADKKTAKDLFKADLADGMDRATAKAKRNKFLQGQMQERADQRKKEVDSGDNAGGRSVTGSRDTFQSEQTREQQIEILERNANKTTAPKTDYSAKFKQLGAGYNTENSGGTGFKPSGVIDYRGNNSPAETKPTSQTAKFTGRGAQGKFSTSQEIQFPAGAAQGNEGELFNKNTPVKMWGAAKSGKTPFKMGGYMSKNK